MDIGQEDGAFLEEKQKATSLKRLLEKESPNNTELAEMPTLFFIKLNNIKPTYKPLGWRVGLILFFLQAWRLPNCPLYKDRGYAHSMSLRAVVNGVAIL